MKREQLYIFGDIDAAAYYKSEADAVMDGYEAKIKELEAKAAEDYISYQRKAQKQAKRIAELESENERLKKQVPVWHKLSEKKPQLRQLILVKYEHKQEYPDKQMDAILWCPMREEELKLDMLTYKEWCELPTAPTADESSATEKENG